MKSNNRRDDVIICRCEEITLGEIKRAIQAGATDGPLPGKNMQQADYGNYRPGAGSPAGRGEAEQTANPGSAGNRIGYRRLI